MLNLPAEPRIALVGAGALGCYYGGRLAQHGHDIHFLLRSDYEHVRAHGMQIKSRDGDFALHAGELHVYNDPRQMPKADLVIVALKTTANSEFASLVSPLLHQSTCILTLQNGLGNEQQLADLFGHERILGGLAFVCINRTAPGQIRHSEYGLIKIGEFAGPPTARLQQIATMFQASQVKCQILENLAVGRWEKLIWNIPFNGLGAALHLSTDQIVGHRQGLALARELMEEVVAVAHAAGIPLDPALIEQNIARTLRMGPYRSSMQIDSENGAPMELESIIGEPLRIAQQLEVSASKMQMLYQLIAVVGSIKS